MHEEHQGGRPAREGQLAALTPRPLRLLLIGRVKPGAEMALRETQARFPHDAAIEAGIEAIEAYIGSGHYAVELEIGSDDIQHVLATFFNDRRVREFRTEIAPMIEGLPGPDYQFGPADRFHPDASGSADGERPPPNGLQHRRSSLRGEHVPLARRRAAADGQSSSQPHGKLIEVCPFLRVLRRARISRTRLASA